MAYSSADHPPSTPIYLRAIGCVAASAIYAISFFLPCVQWENHLYYGLDAFKEGLDDMAQLVAGGVTGEVATWFLTFGCYGWLANPAFWAGVMLLAFGRKLAAAVSAANALVLALVGFYGYPFAFLSPASLAWQASMLVLLAVSVFAHFRTGP